MKIKNLAILGVAAAALSALNSCTQDPYIIPAKEEYTRAFIKQFGLIDPAQDWNLAQEGTVTVDVGSHADVVKIYANVSNDFYLVADLRNVSGKFDVPIDIPESTIRLKVNIDGMIKYINVGESVSRAEMASRAEGDVVTVSDDHSAATQWIMNGQDALKFLEDVPEMQYNRRKETIKTDFLLVGTGEPMVVYPLFWNTNHTHTLGIYYFDTNDTDLEGYSTIKYKPIYTTKEEGDDAHLKIHECTTSDVATYNLGWEAGSSATYNLGWLIGTQTYTLGWQAGAYVAQYQLRFDDNFSTVQGDKGSYIPDWLTTAVQEYLATVNNINTTDDLLEDNNFISCVCNAAKENDSDHRNFDLKNITNYGGGDSTYLSIDLYLAGGPNNNQNAPTGLYNAVIEYMADNNIATYSGINANDETFKTAVVAALVVSEFTWSVNGNNATISYSVNGPANGSSNPAPADILTFIAGLISGSDNYNSLTGDEFKAALDVKIKEVFGPYYSLTSWTPNGQSAEIVVAKSGKPSNTNNIDTEIFNYVNGFFAPGDTYTTISNKDGFLSGLKTLLEGKHGAGVKVEWSPNDGWASIKVSSVKYEEDWVPANATKYAGGTRVNRDGTTKQETLQQENQTAYDYDYEGYIMSQGITVTVQKGKRFGFYIKYGGDDQIRYTELKGNIEWYERVKGTAPTIGTVYGTPQNEMFTYAAMYKKQFPGNVGNGSQSNIQYLLFEDWDDVDESSDADLNDLAIAITGIDIDNPEHFIDHSSTRESEDKELTWLIAAEDLGTTDDFDFNDVVFTISSVTKNVKDTDTTTVDGNVTSSTTTITFTKEVKVTALAAGGTLPVYLHFNTGETDYILGPGNKIIKTSEITDAQAADCEWHSWFGSKGKYDMINTGSNATVTGGECLLGKKKTTTATTTNGSGSTPTVNVTEDPTNVDVMNYLENFKVSEYSESGKAGEMRGFYITVNGYREGNTMNDVNGTSTSDKSKTEHTIVANDAQYKDGVPQAPQMFLIPDQGAGDNGWEWPQERYHILETYASFGTWVNNKEAGKEWYKYPSSGQYSATTKRK